MNKIDKADILSEVTDVLSKKGVSNQTINSIISDIDDKLTIKHDPNTLTGVVLFFTIVLSIFAAVTVFDIKVKPLDDLQFSSDMPPISDQSFYYPDHEIPDR
jgi:hypothetical protein